MIKKNAQNSDVETQTDNNMETADENGMPARRSWFYDASAFVIGGLVGMIPLGIGFATFLDPLRRHAKTPRAHDKSGAGGLEGSIRVASLSALTIGAAPQRFPVIADQIDAWNFSPQQPVGAVFLQRVSDKEVLCFNATCPHAGCSVSCTGQAFVCPCHNSSFLFDGTRRPAESGRDNPSPRNLDTLDVDAEKLAQDEVWVKFQNFYTGKHEKIPKG
jgi:menaquinol-cytochrome c reductase iron-sulfur subunit